MPQIDFHCTSCDADQTVIYPASAVGGPDWPPQCASCGADLSEYATSGVSIGYPGIDAKEPFQRFTIHRQVPTREGLVQVEETIDSVHKLRQIEQDSEQRYRNGEGEPLRFRGYNQDHSNMDQNAFGREGTIGDRTYDSGQAPQKKKNLGVVRHGQRKPKVDVARGGGVSPLR